jgi:hypothetical protein
MILIYSEKITQRLEYITRLIFNQILQVEIKLTTDTDCFLNTELPIINYSPKKFNNEIYIKPHGLLSETGIYSVEITPVKYNSEIYFFESSSDSYLPFDPFAASFYIVSRYEEYLETEFDKFGRFSSDKSILSKNNLLKKPVVNIWANLLADEISRNYPGFNFPRRKFSFMSTIDIDNAWAYLNKGFVRTTGALAKSALTGKFTEFSERLKVLIGNKKDQYDTYEYLDLVFKRNERMVKFFFLLGDYGPFDKNIPHENPNLQKLIRKISNKYDIGIHPSFAGFVHGCHGKVIKEAGRLKKITGKEILKSRNHYLNLKFPKTYQNLIKAGITEDYTLGFADNTGFRAGICTPFYFYDLQTETITNLLVVPFQVMDGTLLHYLSLSPDKALEEVVSLMTEVKNVGGTFVSIWHNETVNNLDEWKGFREVFEKMNRLGFEWANE